MPGTIPALYTNKNGSPKVFNTEAEAESAACRAFFKTFESVTYDTRKAGGYIRISAIQLSNLLNLANVTPTEFAELYGVPQARVMKWLHGEQDIPHSAAVIAVALRIPSFLKAARSMVLRLKE